MEGVTFALVVVIVLAVAFDYINGFHDTANAIATSVATRALSPRHAILMAASFNFIGAFAGTAVAKTIGSGLVDEATTTQSVVAAALIGAITWNLITWWKGLPSSSSHALIGGLLGATILAAGTGALKIDGLTGKVLVPMVVSPFLGFTIAFALMLAIYWIFRNAKRKPMARIFRRLQLLSAGYMAFSHGSNDAQKTMGIITLALFAAGGDPDERCAALGDRRVGYGDVARDGGRWLADHAHDGPARGRARAGPWVRGRDDGGHHPPRHGSPRDAGLDHARDLERHHGRRLRARAQGRALGCRPPDPARLGHHHPGRGHCRRAVVARPAHHRLRLSEETSMTFRLLPKDVRFFELFVADGENLHAAATRLHEMVSTYENIDEHVVEIQRLEKAGDEIDREINRRLEDAFITPFDREDIHELTVRLDDVVDGIQAVAETLVIYDIVKPTEEARELTRILAAQSVELLAALRKLDGLKDVDTHLVMVHDLEHEADGLSRAAIGRLFRDGTAPIDVIKWRDLYRELENAIDAAEDAAEAIERMFHKAT